MKKLLSFIIIILLVSSCVKVKDRDIATTTDNFNRQLILNNWVNNLVIPAYADFKIKMDNLKLESTAFVNTPTTDTQQELQVAMFEAQKVWQHVAMFELQSSNGTRIYMNTYPIDRETSTNPSPNSNEDDRTLEANLSESLTEINNISFENTSGTIDEQGFPALDYLINKENSLSKFTDNETAENYKTYLNKVVDRMVDLTNRANTYWTTNASTIIANSGSSATASFDKMANDYINYVEQGFRENKIANSSGKRDGIENILAVEGYYSSENSKIYFNEAFKAVKNFYYGTSYDGTKTNEGIKDYLDYLNAEVYISSENKDVKISEQIDAKFSEIENTVATLNDDFVIQVTEDNSKMYNAFNVVQEYVVLIKTNTFQALNVKIDYVDSDGD
ncbi:hypothetical protein FHR24_002143 [Wenyingzhuangia heitensis]|uniref:Imelysin-like domain-containing protein n=1 Tax=Wenyingzhuangia heitensis TaxID=1487859 RepID=A0ABX0UA32_9FLAO|nr:imelysin family protein [Wenyingzhuangia heitensis]NIJ45675.1 hypothetical protein [Wenyingzhuangia heitensis]